MVSIIFCSNTVGFITRNLIKAILNEQEVLRFFSYCYFKEETAFYKHCHSTYTWLHNAPTSQFSKLEDVLILRIPSILLTVS